MSKNQKKKKTKIKRTSGKNSIKKKTQNQSLGKVVKNSTIHPNDILHLESNIFKPSLNKIFITIILSTMLVFGWINLINSIYFTPYYTSMYIIFSFFWILFSGIASCLFVYFSNKTLTTRILAHFMKTLFIIFLLSIIYKLF